MDDHRRADGFDEGQDAGAVPDIELVVDEAGQVGGEAVLIPARIAGRAEKDGALVVIDAVDGVAEFAGEVDADLGADEAGGAGDEQGFGHGLLKNYRGPKRDLAQATSQVRGSRNMRIFFPSLNEREL